MSERRMFSKIIVDSDAFLDMPLSTQALYFHLGMRADDEGFVNNPRKIQRMIGATDDDLRILASKKFIIPFDSGIVVIKHWKINNYIRSDRLSGTTYGEEKALLVVKDNGAYSLADKCQSSDSQVTDICQASDSIGKDSIEKYRIYKDIVEYLNEKSGKNFRYSSRKTQDLIKARLNEGFPVDDFKTVIDKKCAEWKGDSKMDQYLRPETLFGTKFEAYLNQTEVKKKGIANFDQREQDWDKLDELFNQ